MSIFWLHPGAWVGLAALAIPVLIHLLVRQRSRRLLFPSLRFLHSTQLASLRRRSISDWLLLGVRMAVLVSAVAALAGPILVTPGRRQAWNQRVARAIVSVPAIASAASVSAASESREALIARERQTSESSERFEAPDHVGDSVRDAVSWLERQPPAAREIVVIGGVRGGSLSEGDIAAIPAEVGIRFVADRDAQPDPHVELAALADHGVGVRTYRLDVTRGVEETRAAFEEAGGTALPDVLVRAAAADQTVAEAMLRAVLSEGLVLAPPANRRLTVVFAGAPAAETARLIQPPGEKWMRDALERLPGLTAGERDGRLVVVAAISPGVAAALDIVSSAVATVFAERLDRLEPLTVPSTTLERWSRKPGPVGGDVRPADEGARRWLWAVALALLVLEQWMRRRRAVVAAPSIADPRSDTEARVA